MLAFPPRTWPGLIGTAGLGVIAFALGDGFKAESLLPYLTPLIIGIAGLWIDSRNTRRAAEKDERDTRLAAAKEERDTRRSEEQRKATTELTAANNTLHLTINSNMEAYKRVAEEAARLQGFAAGLASAEAKAAERAKGAKETTDATAAAIVRSAVAAAPAPPPTELPAPASGEQNQTNQGEK
jgi:hypothetical protein